MHRVLDAEYILNSRPQIEMRGCSLRVEKSQCIPDNALPSNYCRAFKHGQCNKVECSFIHDPSLVAYCFQFQQSGKCDRQSMCKFVHKIDPSRTIPAVVPHVIPFGEPYISSAEESTTTASGDEALHTVTSEKLHITTSNLNTITNTSTTTTTVTALHNNNTTTSVVTPACTPIDLTADDDDDDGHNGEKVVTEKELNHTAATPTLPGIESVAAPTVSPTLFEPTKRVSATEAVTGTAGADEEVRSGRSTSHKKRSSKRRARSASEDSVYSSSSVENFCFRRRIRHRTPEFYAVPKTIMWKGQEFTL